MKQQVDLYQKRFRKAQLVLSAAVVLRVCAAALVSLMLVYGVERWSIWSQNRRLDSLRVQHAAEARRVVELLETHPPRTKDADLEAEVQGLGSEREAKTRLLRILSNQGLGNTGGFSRHIAGLARQRVPGLWLREIRIRRGGHELVLVGSALEPELVPRFIQQLSREAAFVGSDFKLLRLERPEEDEDRIDFALSTVGEAQP